MSYKLVKEDYGDIDHLENMTENLNLQEWQEEIDSYYKLMRNFKTMEVDNIIKTIASFTARVSYMRTQISRTQSKPLNKFRTQEIDFFLDECDRQFKAWSRIHSVKHLDYEISKGF